MRALITATVAAALTLTSGVAMAQYYGPRDPAWADTSDPGSVPGPRVYYRSARPWDHGGYYAYDSYAYGQPYQGDWRWSSGYNPRRGGYDWW